MEFFFAHVSREQSRQILILELKIVAALIAVGTVIGIVIVMLVKRWRKR